jgi:MFS family permease
VTFLLSGVLVAFGLWIRLKLEDTPVFRALERTGDRSEAPIKDVFRTERRALVTAILSRIGPDVVYALFTVFVLSYGLGHGFSRGQVLAATLIGAVLQLGLIPLAGALSDRINRRGLYAAATACAAIWPFVFFPAISGHSFPLLVLGVVIGLALHSLMYGPQAAFVVEQFSPRLRYTGSSLAYTIAGLFGGALAPLAFAALNGRYASWLPVAFYVLVACLLTLSGLALGRDPQPAEDDAYLAAVTPRATPAA